MIILTLRTDKPEAELGLFDDQNQLAYKKWHAHRELSSTIHRKLEELLDEQGKTLKDIRGIVGFEGPGSFTGLRIGLTVANALAYGLDVPIVAAGGDDWVAKGVARLINKDYDPLALPQYGQAAIVTSPRK